MKKKLSVILVALAGFGSAHAQQASSPWYGELGYTATTIKAEGYKLKPGMLRGIIGYDAHPNVAIEGMVGVGVKDDSINIPMFGTTVNLNGEIKHAYGLFVKPKVAVSPALELFARLGYTETKVKATASALGVSQSESDSDGDVSYGVGAAYKFSKAGFATLDYMNYYKKDGVKASGITLGVGMRF
ncbi:porin family protein [Ramlibacter sp. MAHUQ-53]|uniref:porin family protein n=1 Tax=unclassified Ramlibacter TaxID=2617605 RepID=UPI00362E2FFB